MATRKRLSKILPNNSPLAVAARGGEVEVDVRAPEMAAGFFEPWHRKQPAYVAWFRKTIGAPGSRCQCGQYSCVVEGEQVHHEERGVHKDDRSIVWLSRHCHHDVRHHKLCPPSVVVECRAVGGENWRAYCDALEPTR